MPKQKEKTTQPPPRSERLAMAASAMQKGQWGFIDSNGAWIIPAQYQSESKSTPEFQNGYCVLKSAETGATGLMNIDQKWMVPPKYEDIYSSPDNMVKLYPQSPSPEKHLFFSLDAQKTIEFEGFEQVSRFTEGLAMARKGGLYGFIDKRGNIVIDFRYASAQGFTSGLAAVDLGTELDEKGDRIPAFGFIDQGGKLTIPAQYEFVFGFSGEYCVFSENGKWGLINKKGEQLIAPKHHFFNYMESIPKGFLIAQDPDSGQIGILNMQGEWILPPQFDTVGELGESKGIPVAQKGVWGMIDMNGEWLIPLRYEMVQPFHQGFALAKKNGKYGYLNQDGNEQINFQFTAADAFSESMAAVKTDGGWGFINLFGDWVIPPRFEKVGRFVKL